MFLKFSAIDCEYIVRASKGIKKYVHQVILFRFVDVRNKIPLVTK